VLIFTIEFFLKKNDETEQQSPKKFRKNNK
jgi:hypothetical protein